MCGRVAPLELACSTEGIHRRALLGDEAASPPAPRAQGYRISMKSFSVRTSAHPTPCSPLKDGQPRGSSTLADAPTSQYLTPRGASLAHHRHRRPTLALECRLGSYLGMRALAQRPARAPSRAEALALRPAFSVQYA